MPVEGRGKALVGFVGFSLTVALEAEHLTVNARPGSQGESYGLGPQ
jgi:hypothetical protein